MAAMPAPSLVKFHQVPAEPGISETAFAWAVQSGEADVEIEVLRNLFSQCDTVLCIARNDGSEHVPGACTVQDVQDGADAEVRRQTRALWASRSPRPDLACPPTPCDMAKLRTALSLAAQAEPGARAPAAPGAQPAQPCGTGASPSRPTEHPADLSIARAAQRVRLRAGAAALTQCIHSWHQGCVDTGSSQARRVLPAAAQERQAHSRVTHGGASNLQACVWAARRAGASRLLLQQAWAASRSEAAPAAGGGEAASKLVWAANEPCPALPGGSWPEVFLGGACGTTVWRAAQAIPALTAAGIRVCNPQVEEWTPECMAREAHAKEAARILLFVISPLTRGLVSMLEAAEYIGAGRPVVLVMLPMHDDTASPPAWTPAGTDPGLALVKSDVKDVMRTRAYLQECAQRHGVLVHNALAPALASIVRALRPGHAAATR